MNRATKASRTLNGVFSGRSKLNIITVYLSYVINTCCKYNDIYEKWIDCNAGQETCLTEALDSGNFKAAAERCKYP